MILKRIDNVYFYEVREEEVPDRAASLIEFSGMLNPTELSDIGTNIQRFGKLTGFEVEYGAMNRVRTIELNHSDELDSVYSGVTELNHADEEDSLYLAVRMAIVELREEVKGVDGAIKLKSVSDLVITFLCNFFKLSRKDLFVLIRQ
jgi:hypothetical protein